ncbi:preprotein translocase subunit SecE [Corynebacterium minutissimum]|uniref:Protein translocase subunit SecE n=2 Tax=Corynebacteriaceae TaxID=1653 RepID=A0A2X4RPG1_9CORY|nr:preprotein translocase subunit SecE [Corynebacterium minutissimum]KHO30344.1 preprotein translocase subunit SecE [Corynebacterium minutissimum]QPS60300.1 preprotein translocase subunit SecE [Corynebacterium minutissimum]QQA78911.1 preprotein translocase subunit SecE [Corynebacterium minutissimum]SQI00858.1 preprotein translocase subunit SecE [Corynebacterium minutissimum]VEG05074.1 preprotein translocase subunit SecE [Corynebacterium minutissimum]
MSDEKQPSTGAARPTGKRQLSGAATTSTESYTDKRVVRVEDKKEESAGGSVASFPSEVVSEVKKVVWPTGKEMVQYVLVTFAFLIVLTALVWGVDTLTGLGVEAVLAP